MDSIHKCRQRLVLRTFDRPNALAARGTGPSDPSPRNNNVLSYGKNEVNTQLIRMRVEGAANFSLLRKAFVSQPQNLSREISQDAAYDACTTGPCDGGHCLSMALEKDLLGSLYLLRLFHDIMRSPLLLMD